MTKMLRGSGAFFDFYANWENLTSETTSGLNGAIDKIATAW